MHVITDIQIAALVAEGKRVPEGLRPLSRLIERNQDRRRDFDVSGVSGSEFVVAIRQSILNPFDFSAILVYKVPGLNTTFRLRRYNGKSHVHTNVVEHQRVNGFHIHRGTERYKRQGGLKEDSFAEATNRYWSLESAIDCLIEDCGFVLPMNESPLFTGIPL